MKVGGQYWGHNTCGCGHGAHCHVRGDTICMYTDLKGGHPDKASTCSCRGYRPQAAWIINLCREVGLTV